MMEDMETPPLVDPSLFQQVNFVLLQRMHVDDPTLGLYYLENATGTTLFLEAKEPLTLKRK